MFDMPKMGLSLFLNFQNLAAENNEVAIKFFMNGDGRVKTRSPKFEALDVDVG